MQIVDYNEYLEQFKTPELDFNDSIVSIEENGECLVKDIQVSNDNLFFANDVLVHNCAINKIDDVDNSAISDSLGTAMTSDFMLFLLQNEAMKEKNEIICKITKNRFTGKTDTWIMGVDYPHMKFYDLELQNGQTFKTFEEKKNAEDFANSEVKNVQRQDFQNLKTAESKQNEINSFFDELGIS